MIDLSEMPPLSLEQISMMKSAWGWTSKEPGFRTHYCTQLNNPVMVSLVALCVFQCTNSKGFGPNGGQFDLTEIGIAYLKELKR